LVVSRIVAMELVLMLGERGFDQRLINASLASLDQEITSRLSNYSCSFSAELIDPEPGRSSWRDFCD